MTYRVPSFLDAHAQRHPEAARSILTRALTFRARRLIVFLTPGYEWRNGGVLGLATMYRETLAMRHLHHARVALCIVPGDPLHLKYNWFDNRNYLLNLESVLQSCQSLDFLQLHIPAYALDQVLDWLNSDSSTLFANIPELHLNILLWNIDNIQGKNVAGLKHFGKVTATTAHEAYTNSVTRATLGIPLHKLGSCVGPDCYTVSGYEGRKDLLLVSPDMHPLKERVLQEISGALPDLQIQIIQNVDYEDYKRLISEAKWSLTFGEGLDGYFVEPVYTGGVSFAVYNDRFFTPPFARLETVYPSWDVLMNNIVRDLGRLDESERYEACWKQAYDLVRKLHSVDQYRENLRRFYREEYSLP